MSGGSAVAERFKGTVNVDIRDSVPDWAPFEPPKAPAGAPNVLYIVLDDVGFSAMRCYGGPIDTPNIDRIADAGVRYTQWHTTALCSPTRSCLLTGRNHTRNSMACITEAAIGFPNASGTIPPENGMISEILGERGWNTYAVGKWHLCPEAECNVASPRRNWPSGRGFERFYGFLGAETNQWYPDLVYDNHPVDQPKSPAGRLPPDRGHHRQGAGVHPGLQDHRAGQAVLPVLRAGRLPRAAPRAEGVDREVQGPVRPGLRGAARADAGAGRSRWASSRATPSCRRSTRSAPIRPTPTRPSRCPELDTTRPWDSLSADEKRLFCRMAEVYAGFLAHADHHIGRLLDYLEESHLLDNTMVILVSDNGASGEGGPNGSVNENKMANGMPDDIAANLAQLDEIGGPKTYNHYPTGWAMAFNTPFKMWKRYEFNGGTADPCIISWPKGMRARGQVRHHYHHAIDLVPTILDVLGVEAPETIKGHSQSPLDGVSMRYSFDDESGLSARRTQFYSMLGSRAIWHDGWKAATTHIVCAGWSDFGDDTWELYHTDTDRSECRDLAEQDPARLRDLINLWYAEAGANGAFPLDDRGPVEILTTPRPVLAASQNRYVYFPDAAEVPEAQAVNVRNRVVLDRRARRILQAPGAQGVLFAHGSRFGGHALYVKDGRLHYVYNFVGSTEQRVSAGEDIPAGENLILSASFDKDGEDPPGVATGILSLYYGDQKVGEGRIKTQPGKFSIAGEGLCVGRDSGEPVTDDYPGSAPWRFTGGTIRRVAVDVSGQPYLDLEREAAAMLARE